MNNTQSPPAWKSPSPPPGCTHSEQSTLLLRLPPSKPHAPTNRTVHTFPRYTQTYPNTPNYTSKHLAITDRQAGRQPVTHTRISVLASIHGATSSPLQVQLQLKMYSIQCGSSRKQLHFHNVGNPSVHVYVYILVSLSVCQSVCQCMGGCMGG